MDPLKKCTPDNHIRSAESICKDCLVRVCSKCFADHTKHDIIDFEDYLESLSGQHKGQEEELQKAIEKRKEEKNDTVESFKEIVGSHHESQVVAVEDHFREMRKVLETKEYELKNELNSCFEKNKQELDSYIDASNKKIEETTTFLYKFRDFGLTTNDGSTTSGDNELKMASDFNSHLNSLSTSDEKTYQLYTLREHLKSLESLKKTVIGKARSVKLPSNGPKKNSYSDIVNVFYAFGRQGVEKVNIETGEHQKLRGYTAGEGPTTLQFLWNTAVVNQVMYLFENHACWKFDTNVEVPNWVKIPFEGDSTCSACYDGEDTIYVFACNGYGPGVQSIYKFDIKTETSQRIGEKLINSTYLNVSYAPSSGLVYLIGGYNSTDSWLARIDVLDTQTHEIKTLPKLQSGIVSSGIYVEKYKSVFATTWSNTFVKIDPITGEFKNLNRPACAVSNYSKLFYNSATESIYLVVENDRNYYKYDIETDTFCKGESLNLENTVSNSNYLVGSNI